MTAAKIFTPSSTSTSRCCTATASSWTRSSNEPWQGATDGRGDRVRGLAQLSGGAGSDGRQAGDRVAPAVPGRGPVRRRRVAGRKASTAGVAGQKLRAGQHAAARFVDLAALGRAGQGAGGSGGR